MGLSDTLGAKLWEKTHSKQVKKEAEMTKEMSPAGADRTMAGDKGPKEIPLSTQENNTAEYDNTKRRKQLDKALDENN